MRALRAAVAVAVLAALALTGFTASAAPTRCGPYGTKEQVGDWEALRPEYQVGSSATTLLAAPAFDPNRLYASNGSVVMRSGDAGCGWATYWAATSVDAPQGFSSAITAMHAPSSANSSSYLWVGVTSAADLGLLRLGRPNVAVGRDGTFFVAGSDQGLPALGAVREVVANAQLPLLAWAVIEDPTGARTVWATSDAGRSWTQRSAALSDTGLSALASHPTAATELYGVSGARVQRSTDGGATFGVTDLDAKVAGLSVVPGGGGVLMAAGFLGARNVATSDDGGRSWSEYVKELEFLPSTVARGPIAVDRLAVAGEGKAVVFHNGRHDVSPPGGAPALVGLTAPAPAGYYVRGLRGGAVMQLGLSLQERVLRITFLRDALRSVRVAKGRATQFPSSLSPVGRRIEVPPGGHVRLPYDLLVPRTPRPVDLAFLLDSTNSMQSVFEDLKEGIAEIASYLNEAGLEARFGLGDFRDYPDPYGLGGSTDWPYRLDQRLTESPEALAAAISRTSAGGGTSDGGDSPLTALVQSTTGSGEKVGFRTLVPKGQQVGYRKNALRIALLAYDTIGHEGGQALENGRTHPGPTFDSTIATMRAHDVYVAGLSIGGTPRSQLRRLARGTRTLAPYGGVDCDSDGTAELVRGEPLVCLIEPLLPETVGTSVIVGGQNVTVGPGGLAQTPLGIAPAVVSLAAGLPDVQPVTLSVSQDRVVRLVSPPRKRVDLHADNALRYELDVRCPRAKATSRHVVSLAATTTARRLASTTLTVDCGAVGVRGLPAAAALVAGVAAGPAAPANGVPNANPNPNPNANPQTAPNLNTSTGLAQDEQEQGQLALAEGDQGAAEQLEMSAARSGAFVGAAALLLCAATAVAHRRREQLAEG